LKIQSSRVFTHELKNGQAMKTKPFINSQSISFLRKVLLMILLSAGICFSAAAQNKIHPGTCLRISANTHLTSISDFLLNNGGNLNNAGTLVLKTNFTNQNSTISDLGNGTFIFSGSAQQSISGTNGLGSLTMNNPGGLQFMGGDVTVTNSLNLVSGKVTLGANNLLLGPSANLIGNLNVYSMVVATGTGELRKSWNMPGTFTFPVGDNDGTPEYSPVKLVFTEGSFSTGNYTGVNLVNSPYSNTPPSYLNRYWNITQSGISGFTCHTVFHYVPSDVNGEESNLYCARVLPEPEQYFDRADIQWHQLSANWLHSLGTFTGLEPPNVSVPPSNQADSETISVSISPNPFNERTQINVKTACSGNIIVEICNLNGQNLCRLYEGFISAGVDRSFEYNNFSDKSQTLICRIKTGFGEVSKIFEKIR